MLKRNVIGAVFGTIIATILIGMYFVTRSKSTAEQKNERPDPKSDPGIDQREELQHEALSWVKSLSDDELADQLNSPMTLFNAKESDWIVKERFDVLSGERSLLLRFVGRCITHRYDGAVVQSVANDKSLINEDIPVMASTEWIPYFYAVQGELSVLESISKIHEDGIETMHAGCIEGASSVLHGAVIGGDLETVLWCARAMPSETRLSNFRGNTPITSALKRLTFSKRYAEIVVGLLELDPSLLNHVDGNGNTPAKLISELDGTVDVEVRKLIEHGVDEARARLESSSIILDARQEIDLTANADWARSMYPVLGSGSFFR